MSAIADIVDLDRHPIADPDYRRDCRDRPDAMRIKPELSSCTEATRFVAVTVISSIATSEAGHGKQQPEGN